jgi:hypothetical protein
LNELSEEYTKQTSKQMTLEQAKNIIKKAVKNKIIGYDAEGKIIPYRGIKGKLSAVVPIKTYIEFLNFASGEELLNMKGKWEESSTGDHDIYQFLKYNYEYNFKTLELKENKSQHWVNSGNAGPLQFTCSNIEVLMPNGLSIPYYTYSQPFYRETGRGGGGEQESLTSGSQGFDAPNQDRKFRFVPSK